MAYSNQYKKAHLITKVIALPLAVFIIITVCYLFFSETGSISSIIISSAINIFYFFIIYVYLSRIIIREGSVVKIIVFITIYTAFATTIYLLLLEYNILVYPKPFDVYKPPFTFIGGVCAILSLAAFASGFSLYLILNSYLLSIESYSLLMKSHQSEMNILNMQTNPQYISNSIDKLTRFIRNGDIQKSIAYNLELIELMDEQLKYHSSEIISLRDELNWIEYYIQKEQQRILYEFNYTIKIENDSLYDYQIPSMILQTLITDIIKHESNLTSINIHIDVCKISKSEICIAVTDEKINDRFAKNIKLDIKSITTEQDINKRINLVNEIMNFKVRRTIDIDKNQTINKIYIKQLSVTNTNYLI